MASLIIPAGKSLTVTSKLPNGNINGDTITVGYDGINNYISYLFFDISTIPCNTNIEYAELVLFKTDNFKEDNRKVIGIYQLAEYFSTYTTYNNHPEVNKAMVKEFYPLTSKVAVTVNITTFLLYWVRYGMLNTGIMLLQKNNDFIVNFGSAVCRDSYLIPFIKIIYNVSPSTNCNQNNNRNNPTTRQVRVVGTVAPESKYESIVNLQVTRNGSGHKDSYYVTDEYNNLSNTSALSIDKTYNIAIIPEENAGDIETINLYGSYKE